MTDFGPTQTVPALHLQEGDWVDVVPTQHGVRGVRLQALVTAVYDDDDAWAISRGRGKRRTPVDSVRLVTRRGTVSIPVDFDVVMRRPNA